MSFYEPLMQGQSLDYAQLFIQLNVDRFVINDTYTQDRYKLVGVGDYSSERLKKSSKYFSDEHGLRIEDGQLVWYIGPVGSLDEFFQKARRFAELAEDVPIEVGESWQNQDLVLQSLIFNAFGVKGFESHESKDAQ